MPEFVWQVVVTVLASAKVARLLELGGLDKLADVRVVGEDK